MVYMVQYHRVYDHRLLLLFFLLFFLFLLFFITLFFTFIVIFIVLVCEACEAFGYKKEIIDPNVLNAFAIISSIQRHSTVELTEELKNYILLLWNDPAIIRTVARRNEYQVIILSPSYSYSLFSPSPHSNL